MKKYIVDNKLKNIIIFSKLQKCLKTSTTRTTSSDETLITVFYHLKLL